MSWGSLSPLEEFINNLLKAFFRREDLEIFKENLRTLIERLERTERLEVKNMKCLMRTRAIENF